MKNLHSIRIFIVFSTVLVLATTATDTLALNGEYEVVARHSGKCLDVPGSSTANGTNIIQFTCNHTTNQRWEISEGPSGYHYIIPKHSGKCLDVAGSSTGDRALVIQYNCNYTHNQQWVLTRKPNGFYRIVARHSRKALDIESSSSSNGARLVQFTSNNTTNQEFRLTQVAELRESFYGTTGNDKIYFGYDPRGRIKVVINGRAHYAPTAGETLSISGRRGHDVIEFINDGEKDGHQFGPVVSRANPALHTLKYSKFILHGGSGNDYIFGTPYVDEIYGGSGTDYLIGNTGNDSVYGGNSNDVIRGFGGDDLILSGGSGNDYIIGDQGVDRNIHGGSGNDILIGGERDIINGGIGTDVFHCRTNIHGVAPYDTDARELAWNDFPGDCLNTSGNVTNASIDVSDPYQGSDWVFMCHFNMNNGHLYKVIYHTTSNQALMAREQRRGAVLLSHNGVPLHVVHKQYGDTCGPSSLSMIMEHQQLADRSVQPLLAASLARPPAGPGNVDVGYFLSTEHIMYEGYLRRHRALDLPSGYLNANSTLDQGLSAVDASFYEIDYPIGSIRWSTVDSAFTGFVPNWLERGPGVGTRNGDNNFELSGIANAHVAGFQDAMPYGFRESFDNIEHVKRTIKAFIDHNIPLLTGFRNGGHFTVIMGYLEQNNRFNVYMADPLDGWGRPYYLKPMRWLKVELTDDVIDSGLIPGFMVYNHSNTERGCNQGGWAKAIDDAHSNKVLCSHISGQMVNTPYQLSLLNIECLNALEPRDQLMIRINGEDIWNRARNIDNNGTLGSPRNISLDGINIGVLADSQVLIELQEVDRTRREFLGSTTIDISELLAQLALDDRIERDINNVSSVHYRIDLRLTEAP